MRVTAQPPTPRSARTTQALGLGADAGLVSGEAVELDVRVARLGSRVLALLIDIVVQVLLALFLAAALALTFTALAANGITVLPDLAVGRGLQTVLAVLVLVGYPVLCETFNHGRSIGKLAVGLRVIRDDGGPVGFRQAVTRALVGVAVEWPGLVLPLLTWVAGVAVMLTDARGRRLGDLAAGTLVIHDRSPSAAHYRPSLTPPLAGWARTLDLTRLDDRVALAVRQLLSRWPTLTEPARRELATSLWAEVAAVTSPPPPPGLPEWAYLTAVLTERHVRARQRLARSRSVSTALWPELTADDSGSPADGSAGDQALPAEPTPAPTPGVRPATPPPTVAPWPTVPTVSSQWSTATSPWSGATSPWSGAAQPEPSRPGPLTLPAGAAATPSRAATLTGPTATLSGPPVLRRAGMGGPVESERAGEQSR